MQLNYYKTTLKSGYLFPLFDMMHINGLLYIPIFLYEKDIYFLKSFYNSITAKKIVLLSVRDSVTLEEAKSL